MGVEKFLKDVQNLYDYIAKKKENINKLYYYLEHNQFDKLTIIDEFANLLNLKLDEELRVALVNRLVSLRDDSLTQILKKRDLSDKDIEKCIEQAYLFVKEFWTKHHKEIIEYIETKNLLTPFYKEVFKGVYNVGIYISAWQSKWKKHIINNINKELLEKFGSDEKVIEYLETNNLFDIGYDGKIADRSYSVLQKNEDGYIVKAYIDAFKQEATDVIDALEEFSDALLEVEDEIFNQKWQYIKYIQTLIKAFGEKRLDKLIHYWAEVDRAWMEITAPIQIGHPLEYYEDHYRKAVALEWDIRLINPKYQKENFRAKKLSNMFKTIYTQIDPTKEKQHIYNFSLQNVNKVQLYIGRPALFFGAEFNGLFSAQVVPNDEVVSKELGKKIFAFSDEVLQSQRAKPFLKLSKEIFGQEFLTKERKFLFQQNEDWHKVYDITTIGHEFGHILWCDEDTETIMNKSGNFKNIEEFKATTGGLVSFFIDEDKDENYLEVYVINDIIKRAVGLIGWMEVEEVQPYYCEGLIHLVGLFENNILSWDKKTLTIDTNSKNIANLKQWYIKTYSSLAKHYLDKLDATIWLNRFITKEGKYFLPNDENIKSFVQHYFKRYQAIGTQIDFSDKKENYI